MESNEPPSEGRYREMLDRNEELVAEFAESRQFEWLTRHQQREAEFVLDNVGEYLAAYEGVPIDDPDGPSLEFVCTVLYPAKVGAEPDHFGAVAPVLATFFRFLDDRDHLEDGESPASHVEDLDGEIVEAAADPDNWGMAKSILENVDIEDQITRKSIEESGGEFHRIDLSEQSGPPEESDPSDVFDPFDAIDQAAGSTGPAGPAGPAGPEGPAGPTTRSPGNERPGPTGAGPNSVEQRRAILEAFDSISEESEAVLAEAARTLHDSATEDDPTAIFENSDLTPLDVERAYNEVMAEAGVGTEAVHGNSDDPQVLDPEATERFFDWYGKLLVYVNNRFDVVPEIDTYTDFIRAFRDETYPIREHLFAECNVGEVIADFVAENPVDLPDEALSQIENWKHHESGVFAVVEHRETDTVFLDPETPKAFGVTGLESSAAEIVPSAQLPAVVEDVVLLPFEGTIVNDPWVRIDPLSLVVRTQTDVDIDAAFEEAKHRYGVVDSLPAGQEGERTDAEKLRFYTKNTENRERFAEEIEDLKDETDELARIYHEQLGKASARSLGREFRELGLEEAYVGIYDGRVVTTAPTEQILEESLSAIMPDGKADHPYVYHYDP